MLVAGGGSSCYKPVRHLEHEAAEVRLSLTQKHLLLSDRGQSRAHSLLNTHFKAESGCIQSRENNFKVCCTLIYLTSANLYFSLSLFHWFVFVFDSSMVSKKNF